MDLGGLGLDKRFCWVFDGASEAKVVTGANCKRKSWLVGVYIPTHVAVSCAMNGASVFLRCLSCKVRG